MGQTVDTAPTPTPPPASPALPAWNGRLLSLLRSAVPSWVSEIPGIRSAIAGIVGGVAMGLYEMLATWSVAPRLLAPLELMGSTHPFARAHPALLGVLMHVVTAAFWGTKLGAIASAAPPRLLRGKAALMTGLLWGASVWVVMGKIVGPLFNPMIARAPEPHFFIGHVAYGIASAVALGLLTGRASVPAERGVPA